MPTDPTAELWRAVSSGNVWNLRAAIRAGADVQARDKDGRTPMHLAAATRGRADIISELIRAGANADARTVFGRTPLHAASERFSAGAVEALLAGGANAGVADREGRVPLRAAAAVPAQAVVAAPPPVPVVRFGLHAGAGAGAHASDRAGARLLGRERPRSPVHVHQHVPRGIRPPAREPVAVDPHHRLPAVDARRRPAILAVEPSDVRRAIIAADLRESAARRQTDAPFFPSAVRRVAAAVVERVAGSERRPEAARAAHPPAARRVAALRALQVPTIAPVRDESSVPVRRHEPPVTQEQLPSDDAALLASAYGIVDEMKSKQGELEELKNRITPFLSCGNTLVNSLKDYALSFGSQPLNPAEAHAFEEDVRECRERLEAESNSLSDLIVPVHCRTPGRSYSAQSEPSSWLSKVAAHVSLIDSVGADVQAVGELFWEETIASFESLCAELCSCLWSAHAAQMTGNHPSALTTRTRVRTLFDEMKDTKFSKWSVAAALWTRLQDSIPQLKSAIAALEAEIRCRSEQIQRKCEEAEIFAEAILQATLQLSRKVSDVKRSHDAYLAERREKMISARQRLDALKLLGLDSSARPDAIRAHSSYSAMKRSMQEVGQAVELIKSKESFATAWLLAVRNFKVVVAAALMYDLVTRNTSAGAAATAMPKISTVVPSMSSARSQLHSEMESASAKWAAAVALGQTSVEVWDFSLLKSGGYLMAAQLLSQAERVLKGQNLFVERLQVSWQDQKVMLETIHKQVVRDLETLESVLARAERNNLRRSEPEHAREVRRRIG